MDWFSKYKAYVNDNPEGLWFKRKLYGWGWTPVRLEGWLVVLLFISTLLTIGIRAEQLGQDLNILIDLLVPVSLAIAVLFVISYKKGEAPKWTWGLPEDYGSEPDEELS